MATIEIDGEMRERGQRREARRSQDDGRGGSGSSRRRRSRGGARGGGSTVPTRGGVLLAAAVGLLIVSCAVSNLVGYLTNSGGLDEVVLGTTLLALVAAVFALPKMVRDIAIPIGIFVLVVLFSLVHEWSGTPVFDIARATAIVLLAASMFFAGASFRQRTPLEWLRYVQWGAIGMFGLVVVLSAGLRLIQKNIVGGTMLELAIFILAAQYVIKGELTPRLGIFAALGIIAGALMTDHRVMIVIGAAVGGGTIMFSYYRPAWLRALVPLGAIAVAIGAIIALTQLTHTAMMAQLDTEVRETTGRTIMSGRETFWGPIVDAIIDAPLTGYGPTKLARDVTGLQFSTHNAFLQVGLNFGILGLIATIGIILMLIRRAAMAPVTGAGALLSLYLMAVIVHNSSENTLFQNNFPIAALTWINIGFLAASCTMAPMVSGRSRERTIYRLGRR